MHRGHGRMYRRSGPPPWVEHGPHGARHGQGCCHHEAMPAETECECHGARHRHGCCHHETTPGETECECHGARHRHGCCHHEATPAENECECQCGTTAEEEREFLEDLAEALRRHLGRIERRISELEPREA